jgi:hypothetical protein
MSAVPKQFEYFERSVPNTVEKFIKDQGDTVCREMIGSDYIKAKIKEYDFGFVRMSPRANIGQKRRTRQTEQYVYSFVLCKLIPAFKEIDVTLVCARPLTVDGKELLDNVTQRAREMGYEWLSLIALGNARLVRWYQSQGFITVGDKPILDDEKKVTSYTYSMRKRL